MGEKTNPIVKLLNFHSLTIKHLLKIGSMAGLAYPTVVYGDVYSIELRHEEKKREESLFSRRFLLS